MLNESRALYHVNYEAVHDLREGIAAFFNKRKAKWELDAWEDLPPALRQHREREELDADHHAQRRGKL